MSERERQDAEGLRVVAEIERERREELRRISEGGPEQHVPGNVQTGRVEAEAQRVVSEQGRIGVRGFYLRLAGLVALPLAFVALLPAIVGLILLNNQAEQTRTIARENRRTIEQQERALAYLCQTTNVLSLVIGQLELVDKSFLGDAGLAPTVKEKIRSRIRVYRIAQSEFAQREPCRKIE